MRLQNLTKTIHYNLSTSEVIKNNVNSSLRIDEIKNTNKPDTLQSLTINMLPTTKCWLFEHENPEKEFLVTSMKVDKTILYLSEETKELFIIAIELKTLFKIKQLNECQQKLNDSLSYLSIFLATNNHMKEIYSDYQVKFRLAIFCNSENISPQHPDYNSSLCQDYILFQHGTNKQFMYDINSPSLGYLKVPSIRILEPKLEHIEIDFQTLLEKLIY